MLKAEQSIVLPIDYNHILQSVIYHSIGKKLAEFLHNKGFLGNGRVFKLFCFSRLNGNFTMNREQGTITYAKNVSFTIASPLKFFLEELANGILLNPVVRLGSNLVTVECVDGSKFIVKEPSIVVKTLSPVTIYSTFYRVDGRKYTAYFAPQEADYDTLIMENLRKKYQACYGKDIPAPFLTIREKGTGKMDVVRYKNIIIKGYSGILELQGSIELLQMAIDSGLGSKNSQGFGCIDICKNH